VIGRCSSVEHMTCLPPRSFGKSNASMPLLSVVVPVGPLVGRLDNLLSWIVEIQSYSAQVILVVDEKFDGTYAELLEKLLGIEMNTQLLLINEICGGPGAARNRGLVEAKGEWLVFWDCDDQPDVPETFRGISESTRENDVIVCRYAVLRQGLKPEYPKLSYLQIALNPGIWRFIIRREIFKEFAFPDLKLGEDQIYLSLSGVISRDMTLYPNVNYHYVHSGDQQLTNRSEHNPDLLKAIAFLGQHLFNDFPRNFFAFSFRAVILLRLLLTALKRIKFKDIFFSLSKSEIVKIVIVSVPSLIYLRLLSE
jgi:glycosyltransferase involved in cell wall biosynthesis